MIILPKLDYSYDELEPFIDAKTMEIHHGKHHQAYISKFNSAIEGTSLEQKSLHEILSDLNIVPDDIKASVRNNGGGHINHSLFWKIIGPNGQGVPNGPCADKINETFGSFDGFKSQFSNAASSRFGSGWAWLVLAGNGDLIIQSTANQDSPIMEGLIPILGLDVWEHAYYLSYQNRRPDYIEAFWSIVNWNHVEEYFKMAKSSDLSFLV